MVLVIRLPFYKAAFFLIFAHHFSERNLKLAIVILNYNGKHWLEKFLPKLIEYSKGREIYVIDNNSKDDSVSYIKKNFPIVQNILSSENLGFAGGYNWGLRFVEEPLYCLLNSDVEVTENWIEPIVKLFQKEKDIASIQPKILDYNQKNHFEYAGAAGGFIDNLGYPYCRGRMFFDLEKDQGQYQDEIPIFWTTGACMFIKKDDFWEVGGFDADYFAHMEEIDLCWRLHNAHKKVYYCGYSKVYHVGGGTLDSSSPQKTYLNIRNSLYNLVKNLPKGKVFSIVLQRLILDGFAALYFLFNSGFPHFWAVVRAHFSFYRNFPKMWTKRKAGIPNYYQDRYIVLKYFAKRKN